MKLAFSVCGSQNGDEGKGTTIALLAALFGVGTVIRFNGGPQAAHNVVTAEGIHHCFSQLGAGTFSGAGTLLSRFMAVNPVSMLREGAVMQKLGLPGLEYPLNKVTVSRLSPVVTPIHRSVNRLKECLRGDSRHGSCGVGYGETIESVMALGDQALRCGDLEKADICFQKLKILMDLKFPEAERLMAADPNNIAAREHFRYLQELNIGDLTEFYGKFASGSDVSISENGPISDIVAFEGAQGALIHGSKGFLPYTSHSDTSFKNADILAEEWGYPEPVRISVMRAYTTRHGPGPFVTEDRSLSDMLSEGEHNTFNDWQGTFRFGWPDLVALRYGMKITGRPDHIALTCMDKAMELGRDRIFKMCFAYLAPKGADIPDIFETDGFSEGRRVIKDIRLPEGDFPVEATEFLFGCDPMYRPIEPKDIPFILHRELDVPVSIISYGPRTDEKETAHIEELKRHTRT